MALSFTAAGVAINSGTDATSYATVLWTPTANRLVIVGVGSEVASGTANQPTLSGNGLTWTALGTLATALRRVTLFAALTGGSPTNGATTIDFAGQTQLGCEAHFILVNGWGGTTVALGDIIVQVVANNASGATSITVNLAAPVDVNSRPIAFTRHAQAQATTERTNWTELNDQNHGTPGTGFESQARTDIFEAVASASWATSSAASIIAAEVRSADASAAPATLATVTTLPAPTIVASSVATPATLVTVTSITTPDAHVDHRDIPWGGMPWGMFPWGPGDLPFIPGGAAIIGRDEFPPELPPLEYTVVGPNGQSDHPTIVQDFRALEDVGFASLEGYVEEERVRDQPDIYTDGAVWYAVDSSTGDVVAAGDLLTPAIGGGMAGIKAEGFAKRLQRRTDRLMYGVVGDYGNLWLPMASEPYGPNGDGFHRSGEDKYSLSTDGGLRWHISKGTDDLASGNRTGFVMDMTGLLPGVRRIKGRFNTSVAGANFKLVANAQDDPTTSFATADQVIHDFTSGGSTFDFDVDLNVVAQLLALELVRTSGGGIGADVDLAVVKLWAYGLATDDQWTASDVVRDIAGRLGARMRIDDSVYPVLPLDGGVDGVYQDPLDLSAVLSGTYYRMLATLEGGRAVPLLESRRLGAVTWELVDPEFPRNPVPLPRYDSVLIPYKLSNGVAQSFLEVTADSINQPRLPQPRSYGPVALPLPMDSVDGAKLLGQQLLTWLYPPRMAGSATFTRVFGPDGFTSAHQVHAQDALFLPINGGMVLPTKSLSREPGSVTVEFDDGVAPVDRLIARASRQLRLKHPG